MQKKKSMKKEAGMIYSRVVIAGGFQLNQYEPLRKYEFIFTAVKVQAIIMTVRSLGIESMLGESTVVQKVQN